MISLYFHVPFCRKKCLYCDFYSETDTKKVGEYIYNTEREIDFRRTDEPVESVFFGGGTPSVLNPSEFKRIAEKIKDNFNLNKDCEWTVECNPESFSVEKAKMYLSCGVTRLSFGIQSLNEDELKTFGRIHSAKEAEILLQNKILENFKSINIDLIYGLDKQTEASFMKSLKKAVSVPTVKHISLYELTLSEKNILKKANEEEIEKIEKTSRQYLKEQGFERYEISNFAKENHRCRHNENYWLGKKYLGFGPSACSFDGKSLRTVGTEQEKLTKQQERLEYLMLRLRTSDGFYLSDFKKRFSEDLMKTKKQYIENLIKAKYLSIKPDGRLHLSDSGLNLADGISTNL